MQRYVCADFVGFKSSVDRLYSFSIEIGMMSNFLIVIIWVLSLCGRAPAVELKGSRADVDPVNVRFLLYTRQNPTTAQVLILHNSTLLDNSNFDKSLPVKIFAHGWDGFPNRSDPSVAGWLQQYDCNAISVDWSVLASGPYNYVAANGVPVAGATTGAFVNFLIEQGTPVDSFHLVGFSMGAHVVGHAGAGVTSGKVPRITGLDPASLGFPLESLDTRLDTTDADFVDVIHTSLAFINATGHADFYPNGGQLSQPGCAVPEDGCCSHCRAVELFAESITSSVKFRSVECESYAEFESGVCDGNPTASMGEPISNSASGSYFLNTNAQPPYALG